MSARYSQEKNPKRTSKTALLNDKFSRAVFLLVLFIFPPRDMKESQVENRFYSRLFCLIVDAATRIPERNVRVDQYAFDICEGSIDCLS